MAVVGHFSLIACRYGVFVIGFCTILWNGIICGLHFVGCDRNFRDGFWRIYFLSSKTKTYLHCWRCACFIRCIFIASCIKFIIIYLDKI